MVTNETLQKNNIGTNTIFSLHLTLKPQIWWEWVNKKRKIKQRLIRNFRNLRGDKELKFFKELIKNLPFLYPFSGSALPFPWLSSVRVGCINRRLQLFFSIDLLRVLFPSWILPVPLPIPAQDSSFCSLVPLQVYGI
jgi:hypothetical protein